MKSETGMEVLALSIEFMRKFITQRPINITFALSAIEIMAITLDECTETECMDIDRIDPALALAFKKIAPALLKDIDAFKAQVQAYIEEEAQPDPDVVDIRIPNGTIFH
jgi:hypothetical protein